MTRIAYLCLETPHVGRASHTHVMEIIDGLRARGRVVDLIVTRRGGYTSQTGYVRRGLDYFAAQWTLMRTIRTYDAVYMRAHFAALPASLWARLRGVPVIQEINGQPDDIVVSYPWLRWLAWPLRQSYAWQMRWAAHVIVVTEGLRHWARAQCGHRKVSVVTNGANVRVFSPAGPKPEIDSPYIAFVGGIAAWHGIDVMLAATRDPAWPEGVRLIIIGDGKDTETLRAAAAEASSRIMWLGRLPQDEAAMWLRGALGALSITQDASGHLGTGVAPLKLFEAMASGTALIVSDLPFQAALIRVNEAGLVIPMHDPQALAQAVAQLAASPAATAAMGVRAAAYAQANASWQARADETDLIIEAALNDRR